MTRLLRISRVLALAAPPVAGLALLLAAPSAGASPAPTSSTTITSDAAFVDAFSVSEIARAARALPLGGRLRLDGLVLASSGPAASPQTLELERVQVFAPGAEVVVHGTDGTSRLPIPDDAFFRGTVVGDPDSFAFLAVHADGAVRGAVRFDGRVSVLGEESVANGEEVGLAARVVPAAEHGFRCAAGDLAPPAGSGLAPWAAARAVRLAPKAQAATYTAQVAIETDYELFQKFGNTTDETSYITELIGFSSGIYDAEIATDLQISYLSLWSTAADPWTQTSSLCGLFEVGRYWNDNRSGVTRTITHMMSGKSGKSGVAWVGVLCDGAFNYNHGGACPSLTPQTDNYGGAYGYTGGLDGNFNAGSPSVVWDIVAVTHEIGHNFNSPHTHCYAGLGGSSSPVDKCYNSETGCYTGTRSLPCATPGAGCGTIMSYCHLLSPGLSNISLTFGTGHPHGVLPQRVPDRMRAHADSTASFSTCLDRIPLCHQLTLSHTGPGSDPAAAPTESTGCSAGYYKSGESIALTAAPAGGNQVYAWSGTDDDTSTSLGNSVTFGSGDHAVSVDYCAELVLFGETVTTTVTETVDCTIRAGSSYTVSDGGDVTLTGRRVILENGFAVDGVGARLELGTQ